MDTEFLSSEFVSGMKALLGDDYQEFRQSLSGVPPTSIRINPDKACDVRLPSPVPWTQYGTYLAERPVFTLDPRFHAGAYYVQEASSMFVEQAVRQYTDDRRALNVLDLCAAPGGKSTHLVNLVNGDSLLVANEAIRTRVPVLVENLEKWGKCNVIVSRNDPDEFCRLPEFFDVIVVDAPCSGEGLFRKEVRARQQWSGEGVSRCAARQKRILAGVWPSLREGGILIYSTCTFNKRENEENIHWLCGEFGAESLPLAPDASWGVVAAGEGNIYGYRFYPHKTKGEGFFMSVVRKTAPTGPRGVRRAAPGLAVPRRENLAKLTPWIDKPEDKHFFEHAGRVRFLGVEKLADAEYVIQQLRTMSAGTAMATIKQNKMVPDHALALSLSLNRQNVRVIDVDEEAALRLLRREHFDLAGGGSGFAVVTFRGLSLAWVNILPGRVNNLYPSHRRIRMSAPAPSGQ